MKDLVDLFYRDVMEASLVGIYVIEGLRFRYVNSTMAQIFGYEPVDLIDQMSPVDLVIPEQRERVRENLLRRAEGEPGRPYEVTCLHRDGRQLDTLVWGKGVTLGGDAASVGTLVDITTQREAERQRQEVEARMQQAQRLESLGVLAGGIAHDLNNILAAILGNIDLVSSRDRFDSQSREALTDMRNATQRAAELSTQMLTYAGQQRFAAERVCLDEMVTDLKPLLRATISKDVRLEHHHLRPSVHVSADPTQLRQVLLNLAINGAESIDGVGQVTIRTGVDSYTREALVPFLRNERQALTEGSYAYVKVQDSGHGMDDEVVSRIFDPFFSTKRAGRGLGLSAVLGIVHRHGGGIRIQSAAGAGTTFTVLLPAIATDDTPRVAAVTEKTSDLSRYAGQRILMVDDELIVRKVSSRMLAHLGFEVLEAGDGFEALALAEEHPDIVCVLLDLTMPRKDGIATLRSLREQRFLAPVILCSGYHQQDLQAVIQQIQDSARLLILTKPYQLSELEQVLLEALSN